MPKGVSRGKGKGKGLRANPVSPATTPFAGSTPDLNDMYMEEFSLWSEPALKTFLSVRKKSIEGNFDELVARYV